MGLLARSSSVVGSAHPFVCLCTLDCVRTFLLCSSCVHAHVCAAVCCCVLPQCTAEEGRWVGVCCDGWAVVFCTFGRGGDGALDVDGFWAFS